MTQKALLTLLYAGVLLGAGALKVEASVFATPPPGANASGPDSITDGAGSIWVSYDGGTNSDGTNPNTFSTIVRYSPAGAEQNIYKIQGDVDGLKYNPFTGQVWALQNQDANSHLTLIDPVSGTLTSVSYAVTSPTQGYDDVVFTKNGTYLSETNPSGPSDVTLVKIVPGTSPIQVTPLLTSGSPGLNVNTGKTGFVLAQPVNTDSLKLAPNGTLYQTTGANRDTIGIYDPATGALKYLTLTANGKAVSGMDDTLFITSPSGILYATATNANEVDKFNISLPTGTLIASIGSLDEIAIVDPSTGNLTPFLTGLDGIHGLDFVPTVVPETSTILTGAITLIGGLLIALRRRQKAVA
jgi:hypothetical protein